ncbi:MAG: M50 family metallopeptidase [Gemmataceae bacterium]
MTAPNDRATAYHEAGHAVAALVLGRSITKVSIRPNRERLGICAFGKAITRPSKDWIEQEILISLAGMAAEARLTGVYARDSAERDLRYVRDLAVQRSGHRQADRLERRLLAKTEYLLADEGHWEAVERIATELLSRGEISGRAARHLFELSCRTT